MLIKKKRFGRLPLNLQTFAETEATTEDGQTFEIDESEYEDRPEVRLGEDGSIEVGEDEQVEEELQTETGSDQQGSEELPKEEVKNPTANAVIAERNKWKAKLEEATRKASAADKLMRLSGLNNLDELQARLDAAEADNLSKQSGLSAQQAQYQIQQKREMEELKRSIQKQRYDGEVLRLKADPFFSDIDHYRDDFEEIAERTGQTLEEVYFAKRGRERMKEREREIEQTMQANRSKKQAAKVDTSNTSASDKSKSKSNLTPDQLAIAKLAGMSPAEYAKYMKK